MTTSEDVERAKREAVRGDVVTVRWVCMRRKADGCEVVSDPQSMMQSK